MSSINLAIYLRKRMNELNISNSEVADRAGISRQTWYRLLNAEIGEAKLTTLISISYALNTSPSHLFAIYFNQPTNEARLAVAAA